MDKKIKIVKTGFAAAMAGEEIWVNTTTDERVTITIHDKKLRWGIYCKPVRITIEQINEDEIA